LKIAIVLGTRPEIVKMSPVIRESERLGLDYQVIHTGQHYSHEMDRVFFDEFSPPSTKDNLEVGSSSQAEQTSRILLESKKGLLDEASKVPVLNNTNTVINGSLIDYQVMI
jgi:UDP-N-acetylglucosamine 2-epimerase (non-hydrolysing)